MWWGGSADGVIAGGGRADGWEREVGLVVLRHLLAPPHHLQVPLSPLLSSFPRLRSAHPLPQLMRAAARHRTKKQAVTRGAGCSLGKSWAESAKAKGGESSSVYSKIAGIIVITWFLYPIVWVFAEGFGNFSVTFEVTHPSPHPLNIYPPFLCLSL